MRIFLTAVQCLLLLSGCSEQLNTPGAMTPREHWRSQNIHHYTIEQRQSCFCMYGGQTMLVTVVADTVQSVMRLSDSLKPPYPDYTWYHSVDSLFGIIQYSQNDSLVITYDAQYGFPNFLDINPQDHPVDGGVLIETSNLKRLQ